MEETQNQVFEKVIDTIKNIAGVDLIYFLDNNYQIIKEHSNTGIDNYLKEISNILKSEPVFNKVSTTYYGDSFHTFTLLNETGLIVVSKLHSTENFHMIVIAGEKEPIDLINLLKICKEARIKIEALGVI